MLNIAPVIGMISIVNSFIMLCLSFLPILKKHSTEAGSLRLIAILQSLGGLLCLMSAVDFIVTSYAFAITGLLLISASLYIAFQLRPGRAKRKSKPKHPTPYDLH